MTMKKNPPFKDIVVYCDLGNCNEHLNLYPDKGFRELLNDMKQEKWVCKNIFDKWLHFCPAHTKEKIEEFCNNLRNKKE